MIFTKVRKAVAIVLLFALLFSTFPMSALANDTDNPEETAVTDETATVETTTAPTDGCLETEQETGLEPESTGEDEQDLMWVINPETGALELVRGLHHRLIRSNTVTNGWGGIYARQGAGSVSFTYTRANNTTATFSLNAAYDNSGDMQGIGIVHYLLYSTTNDTLSTVTQAPVAYCIDPVKTTANYMHYENGSEYHYMMTDVLSNDKLNAIKLACAYGWPYGFSDAYSTTQEVAFKRQFATQIIIWEIVMGLRGTSGTYAATDNRLYDHYAGVPWSSYYGSTNDAYISAYQEISARLARHNTYPSFASSSASNASVYAMTYSGGQYTYTLTDSNGVLSPDFSSFSAPSGVTVTKNGNTLTITATEAAMASGEVTVSMTGRKMQAGTTYVWFAVDNEDTSIIYSSRQPLTTIEAASSVPAYFKLKADTKTVSIKKTSNASASVQACIQDNPLYTLAGAKYEIYEGTYPNGTLRETLTTDINGNATGTVKYNIGTKLWAKEIVAPPGYLMPAEAQNHYPLTVSSGDNVFNVSDTPTFDPQRLVINKTGTDNARIQGAVFEVKYYAQYWIEDSKLRATWYFMSDENGKVQFDDNHLLSSYGGVNSDPLYKPNGVVSFPLGCAVVKEVKAANGYVLPSGNTGRVCIFIKQGGPNPQNGATAGAYWGDFAANPLDSNHPKDIYKIENDSEKQTITAVNESIPGTMTMRKSLPTGYTGSVEGYKFQLSRNEDGSSWYGKSDANGNVYKTNSSFVEANGSKRTYTFDGLQDGTFTFREKLDGVNAKTTKVRFYTSGGVTPSVDITYTGSSLTFASNGDCLIGGIVLTGLNGGGNLTIEIENTPFVYGEPFELVKTDLSDVKLEGAIFKVQYYDHDWIDDQALERTWYFRTDANGFFTLNSAHLLNTTTYPSDALFPDGQIPLGIMTVTEEKAPTGFKKAEFTGVWCMEASSTEPGVVNSYWIADSSHTPASAYGDHAYVLNTEPGKLYVKNKPVVTLKIYKRSVNGTIQNIEFLVEKQTGTNTWENVKTGGGYFTTNSAGLITVSDSQVNGELEVEQVLRITEIVPEGSICTSENPQIITLVAGTNNVFFENVDISLEISKTSSDGNIQGIQFEVSKRDGTAWTVLGTYTTDANGKIAVEIQHLAVGAQFRIREIVPENYICSGQNPKTITLKPGKNTVSFENKPSGDLEIIKTCSDGHIEDIGFYVEQWNAETDVWSPVLPAHGEVWITDENGKILIPGLVAGIRLRITEDVPAGYICESRNPQTITIVKGLNTVSFENRPIIGNLEITKVDEAYPDHKLTGAEFTVTMTKDSNTETAVMTEVLDEQGNGTGVYRLEHIAYGTVCEIRETKAPDGYELPDDVWTVTIAEEKNYTIATPDFDCVTNKQIEGKISVHKEDADHNAMSGVQFLLEYSVDNGATWAPVQARTAEDPILPGYCTSEGLSNGILSTNAEGNIVFTGLALSTEINSNVLYRLTEVKTLPGYSLLADPVFEGMLTSEEYDLAFTAVNHSTFKMPMTGGNGFVGATIGSILTVLASLALALLFIHRRKAKS